MNVTLGNIEVYGILVEIKSIELGSRLSTVPYSNLGQAHGLHRRNLVLVT